jgi:hypothetical protein
MPRAPTRETTMRIGYKALRVVALPPGGIEKSILIDVRSLSHI